jgi:hypothetical protein
MEEKRKFKKHFSFSKKSFIYFVISLIFYLYMKIAYGYGGDFLMLFVNAYLYTPYIAYLIIHTLFVSIFYKKILKFNIVAFILIFIVATLNYTGFSYPKGRYLTKAEQIDIGLKSYLSTICYNYKTWHEKKDECPYTFEKLREQYPQCFTKDRPDDCELYQYRKNYSPFFDRLLGFRKVGAVYSKELTQLLTLSSYQYCTIFSSGFGDLELSDINFFEKNFETRNKK